MAAPFLERRGSQVRIRVRVSPGARSEGFSGTTADASGSVWLRASVRAVAEKGRANEALMLLLSAAANIARSRIFLISGETARAKTLAVEDCAAAEEAVLGRLAEP